MKKKEVLVKMVFSVPLVASDSDSLRELVKIAKWAINDGVVIPTVLTEDGVEIKNDGDLKAALNK